MYLIAVHHVHNAILSSPSPSLTYKVKHLQNHVSHQIGITQSDATYPGHSVRGRGRAGQSRSSLTLGWQLIRADQFYKRKEPGMHYLCCGNQMR